MQGIEKRKKKIDESKRIFSMKLRLTVKYPRCFIFRPFSFKFVFAPQFQIMHH